MAQTFKRICLQDYTVADGAESFTLKRGQEYTTSPVREGKVRVYSSFWVWVPAWLFAGAVELTKADAPKCSLCGGSGVAQSVDAVDPPEGITPA